MEICSPVHFKTLSGNQNCVLAVWILYTVCEEMVYIYATYTNPCDGLGATYTLGFGMWEAGFHLEFELSPKVKHLTVVRKELPLCVGGRAASNKQLCWSILLPLGQRDTGRVSGRKACWWGNLHGSVLQWNFYLLQGSWLLQGCLCVVTG